MTRGLLIDPGDVRGQGELVFVPVAVNRYDADIADERVRYGDARLTGTPARVTG